MKKLILLIAIILGMVACKKQDYSENAWVVEATTERLEIKAYSHNSILLQTQYLNKKDQFKFDKTGISKIEVRCGNCQYKVNGSEYRLDFSFSANGKITSIK